MACAPRPADNRPFSRRGRGLPPRPLFLSARQQKVSGTPSRSRGAILVTTAFCFTLVRMKIRFVLPLEYSKGRGLRGSAMTPHRGGAGPPIGSLPTIRDNRVPGKATQGHPKATLKPYTVEYRAISKPPQGHPKATPRLPQSHPKATPRLPQGYPKATPRPPQGHPKATPRLPQGYPKARERGGGIAR